MRKVFHFAILGILALIACNESTTIGSDFVLEEDFELGFTDTLSFKTRTITSGPVPTYYNINFINSRYMLGELDDPVLGKAKSSVYLDMQLGGATNFVDGELDKMVFILGLSEGAFYGDSTAVFDINVWELSERMDMGDTIYSDQTFQRFDGPVQMPVASAEGIIVSKDDSVTFASYITDEEVSVAPQIRMRVNDRFAQRVFNDSIANRSNDDLIEKINGFLITASPDNSNSMIGLDLLEFSSVSGLEVHYVNELGAKTVYRYVFSERRHQHFEISQDGSAVDNYLGENITNGEPLFVQGMSGVVTEIDLSSVKQFDTELLNLAELEFFLYDSFEGNDATLYPSASSLALINARTGLEIADLQYGRFNGFIDLLFGGQLQETDVPGVFSYKMNLTSYLKDTQYDIEDGILRLEILDKTETPRRTILYGPGHPSYAPKLKVTYTVP